MYQKDIECRRRSKHWPPGCQLDDPDSTRSAHRQSLSARDHRVFVSTLAWDLTSVKTDYFRPFDPRPLLFDDAAPFFVQLYSAAFLSAPKLFAVS